MAAKKRALFSLIIFVILITLGVILPAQVEAATKVRKPGEKAK
jgi:hypothetical protein